METDMNDRRMVPAGGVSADEVFQWITTRTPAMPHQISFIPDYLTQLVLDALARWGAQTEYDATKAARAYSNGEISAGKFGELLGLQPGELHDFKTACGAFDEGAAVRSSRRPVAQTEYDPVKVEALLLYIDGEHPTDRRLRERAAAVHSSRRPKGRVVEGWAAMIRGSAPAAFYLNERMAEEHAEILIDGKVSRCRIEILDAPEEGR